MTRSAFILAALLLSAAPLRAEPPALWTLEEGSRVGFEVTQSGAPIEGRFEAFEAEIRFDPERLEESRVRVEIDVASVNSDSADRDGTIRSKDLFDVATWPLARFEADRFVRVGDGAYEAHGALTLRDATMDVVLPFELAIAAHPDDAGAERARATGALTVLRLDYGVGQGLWQDTSVVPNEVRIVIEILAKRPKT